MTGNQSFATTDSSAHTHHRWRWRHHHGKIYRDLKSTSEQLQEIYLFADTAYSLSDLENGIKEIGTDYDIKPLELAIVLTQQLHDPAQLEATKENLKEIPPGSLTPKKLLQAAGVIETYDTFTFAKPLESYRISSHFGHREKPGQGATSEHPGVDLAAPGGSTVCAVMPGVIEDVRHSKIGDIITVCHGTDPAGKKIETRYIHMSDTQVRVGDVVQAGQPIASVASNVQDHNDWTGPHLHLEVRVNGVAVNPEHYIRENNPESLELATLASSQAEIAPQISSAANIRRPLGQSVDYNSAATDPSAGRALAASTTPSSVQQQPTPGPAAPTPTI